MIFNDFYTLLDDGLIVNNGHKYIGAQPNLNQAQVPRLGQRFFLNDVFTDTIPNSNATRFIYTELIAP